MDFAGQLMLAYLEEDDTRRVLFRVRPLISQEGTISPEDLEELEQDGFMRIAPDRQEQHSFKERMSELGSLCLIDLTHAESAMGKVRLNKNYAPGRGENNRYIIYSDAIQALPREMVYEVVAEDKSHTALTSQYYLRAGGRISGPHCPQGSIACPASQSLMPDCERLFLVEMPDGISRMFYWPHRNQADEPAQNAGDMPADDVKTDEMGVDEDPLTEDVSEELLSTPAQYPLFDAARAQMDEALSLAGFDLLKEDAAHLLIACLLFERVGIFGDNLSDACLAAQTVKDLFPALAVTLGHKGNGSPQHALRLLVKEEGKLGKRYTKNPWPIFHIKSGGGIPCPPQEVKTLNMKVLSAFLEEQCRIADIQEADLDSLLLSLTRGNHPLPLRLRAQIAQFYRCVKALHPQTACAGLIEAVFTQPYYRALGIVDEDAQHQWAL
ncbi:MAG: hypothetical protein GXZ04_05090 [Clostridiales bacterium]|nr:hypothetical protein [Clostridiales bacterium]